MPIVFPGNVSGKNRLNLDELSYQNPYQTIMFGFNASHHRSVNLITLPKNVMVYEVVCKVIEAFDAVNSRLEIGTDSGQASIAMFNINNVGLKFMVEFDLPKFYRPFTQPENIRIAVTALSGTNTRGSGFGVINYLDLNLIESNKKIGI